MSKSALRLLAGLAAVIALWVAWSWYASDARRIRRQLSTLQELVGKTPLESEIQGLGKARKAAELFAERFEFRAPQFDFATRDRGRLISAIHQYRSRSDTIAMRIFDHDLALDAAAERATSVFTAEFITGVRGTLGREGYRFQLNWLRTGGGWRIDYVELLEILEEPVLPLG